MSIREVIALECGCEKCQHVWKTRTDRPPEVCPKCKRKDWNFTKSVEVEKEIERINEPKIIEKPILKRKPIEVETEYVEPEREIIEIETA